MYYLILYSLILTMIIFSILQYIEKENNKKKGIYHDVVANLFTTNSIIVLFILFLMNIIILYFVLYDEKTNTVMSIFSIFSETLPETSKIISGIKKNNIVDPAYLKRINDPINCGFEPYSCNSDANSTCSSSSSSSSSS